jgi:hypothetical protein
MNLISTLNAGIAAAANGWAEVYIRGTSTRATVYFDFEASTSDSSGDDIDLDAYGAVEVYVNQLVDVVAKSPDGTVIRSWTDGYASRNVEVISPSFTGNDYVSGVAAVNEPTTLQAVLDLWVTNAGAPDWKVSVGGAATTLTNALGGLTGLVYNVKSPIYGGVGDGVANDQAAIQAALAAAVAAGGGVVFLPAGTYLISTAIEWDHRVSLIGIGANQVTIKTSSVSNARILTLTSGTAQSAPILIHGVSFDASQSNTGEQFYSTVAVNVRFVGCVFGVSSNCAGNLIRTFTNGGKLRLDSCRFTAYAGYAAYLAADVTMTDCRFFSGAAGYNQELIRLDSVTGLLPSYYAIFGCIFDGSSVSVPPTDLSGVRVVSTLANVAIGECHFVSTANSFNVGIIFLGGGKICVNGTFFPGCIKRYSGNSATVPLAKGSFLETSDRSRESGAVAAYTVFDCVSLAEIVSTGTAPTVTMPAMLFPSQQLGIYILNNSGGNWASVTFAGTYTSLVGGATAVNNGQSIYLTCVLSDLATDNAYRWHIVDVRVG